MDLIPDTDYPIVDCPTCIGLPLQMWTHFKCVFMLVEINRKLWRSMVDSMSTVCFLIYWCVLIWRELQMHTHPHTHTHTHTHTTLLVKRVNWGYLYTPIQTGTFECGYTPAYWGYTKYECDYTPIAWGYPNAPSIGDMLLNAFIWHFRSHAGNAQMGTSPVGSVSLFPLAESDVCPRFTPFTNTPPPHTHTHTQKVLIRYIYTNVL